MTLRTLALLLFVFSAFVLSGCEFGPARSVGLIAEMTPVQNSGVRDPERLNDGVVPREGGDWNSNRASIFSGQSAYVDFDLGEERPIVALALMGDNNDIYEVLGSADGKRYAPIWGAGTASGPGMRWRHVRGLAGQKARYLRLKPKTGDVSLSVAEFVVYSEDPEVLPPKLRIIQATDDALGTRTALLTCAALVGLAVFFMSKGAILSWNLIFLGLALYGFGHAFWVSYQSFPIDKLEVSLTRAVAASIAAAVAARFAFSPPRFDPPRWFQVGVLSVVAVVSVGAFYNFGWPQFYDHKNKEPSVVHNYDMRVYFPVAKYFDELKYDGLYLGSIATYAEEHGGLKAPHIQRAELRDLRDHRMRKLSELEAEAVEVKTRFSEERWKEFKKDMSYFWDTMGSRAYLGSMSDHGGNATPVWLSIAYLMYGNVSASNEVLLWGGALDPLLLLIFAIVVFRSFGAPAALISLVLYGANDFYMFGSNWSGATLRNDWMVYLGLGVCALKTERYRLGGAFLALSMLIRAFPAITLLALGIPVIHYLVVRFQDEGRLPSWSSIWKEQRWFFDTAIGATVCVVVSVVGSSMILGWDAWPLWVDKISSFTASPHVNHISLLTMIAGSEGRQALVLEQRSLVFGLTVAVYFALAIWAGARSAPYRVALLGIMMMPVAMYPANYYVHFIFLLALLVDEKTASANRWAREAAGKTWVILLAICAAQYFTVRETDLAIHFYNASVILMVGLLFVLIALLPRDEEGRLDFNALPFVKGPADFAWLEGGRRLRLRGSQITTAEPHRTAPKSKKKKRAAPAQAKASEAVSDDAESSQAASEPPVSPVAPEIEKK
jgi:ABC-type proline/glycine betaine transport system permease subunit